LIAWHYNLCWLERTGYLGDNLRCIKLDKLKFRLAYGYCHLKLDFFKWLKSKLDKKYSGITQ